MGKAESLFRSVKHPMFLLETSESDNQDATWKPLWIWKDRHLRSGGGSRIPGSSACASFLFYSSLKVKKVPDTTISSALRDRMSFEFPKRHCELD